MLQSIEFSIMNINLLHNLIKYELLMIDTYIKNDVFVNVIDKVIIQRFHNMKSIRKMLYLC